MSLTATVLSDTGSECAAAGSAGLAGTRAGKTEGKGAGGSSLAAGSLGEGGGLAGGAPAGGSSNWFLQM